MLVPQSGCILAQHEPLAGSALRTRNGCKRGGKILKFKLDVSQDPWYLPFSLLFSPLQLNAICLLLREERQRVLILKRALCYAQVPFLLVITSQLIWGQVTPPAVRFPSGGGTPAPLSPAPVTPPAPALPAAPAIKTTPPPSGTLAPSIPPPPQTPGFDPYADPTLPTSPYQHPAGTAPPFVTDPALAGQKTTFHPIDIWSVAKIFTTNSFPPELLESRWP